MSTATQGVTGIHYEELMKGVDDETRELVERMIVNFCNDEDQSAAEEKARSDKLRSAYNTLVDFLVNNKLNDLNPQQKVFLCTGAIGDLITVQAVKPPRELDLLPTHFYDMLIKIFSGPDPNARTLPVFSVLEKFIMIAKTDLVALTFGDERKKALRNSPQDRKRAKDDVQRKLDAVRSEITLAAGQIDIYFPKLLAGMGEAAVKNVKNGLEMLKRVSAAWGKGDLAEEQEKNFQKANEAKVGETGLSIAKWVDDVAQLLKLIRDNARMVDERYQAFQRLNIEVARIDSLSPTTIQRAGPLFNSDSISQIKVDIDTTNSSIVRAADSSAVKVPFSASRILLYKQFNDNEDFEVRFCSPPRVIASLEKILAIHVNLFPKDGQGRFIIPPILLEPLRNYVDFFQDRFIMGIVTGESERKGPFASFSPVDVQVLRLCGLFLSKDPIYDYRGDI
jgi:hypothetical protein